MSAFSQELQLATEFSVPESFDAFFRNIPEEWIKEAVAQTGRASVRKRRFPAEQVVWLVLGIGMMRNRSITEVCDKLDLAFPDSNGELPSLASSSVTTARLKLGYEPLRYLFHTTASHWEQEDAKELFHGLKVMAVDGTQFQVPETQENQKLGYAAGKSSFPSVLAVALMSVRSHLITDAAFGPVTQGEIQYAQQLVGSAPENSLTLFDRAYFSAELLLSWQQSAKNCHWLIPIKSKFRHTILESFSEHDHLVSMPVSPQARAAAPYLPEFWTARLILIPEPGGKIKGFITSLVDPALYPFADLAKIYWDRWEIEQGYGELKRWQMNHHPMLRSKSVSALYQELWGLLIGYNLVRLEMRRMADDFGVPPLRISFLVAFTLILDEFLWCSGRTPGTIPKKLANLRSQGKRLILPEKRKRSYPRIILRKTNKYPVVKRATRS